MPSTARQLRQPPTIKAIGRVPYFADEGIYLLESTTRAARYIRKWYNNIITQDSKNVKLLTSLLGSPFKVAVTITLKPTTKSKVANS